MCDFYKGNTGKKFEDLTAKDLEHVLIDRERKLLYCYVPKVIMDFDLYLDKNLFLMDTEK